MNYLTLLVLSSFLFTHCVSKKSIKNQNDWIEHRAVYTHAGFELEFKYPNNLVIARQIDNCICVGINTEYYDEDQASPEDNTRPWCICLFDSTEYTADYMISTWKNAFNGEVVEIRDTVTVGNIRAIRATLRSIDPGSTYIQFSGIQSSSYIQMIYFNKFSALFEIANQDELTSKDFEIFSKSIKVKELK